MHVQLLSASSGLTSRMLCSTCQRAMEAVILPELNGWQQHQLSMKQARLLGPVHPHELETLLMKE